MVLTPQQVISPCLDKIVDGASGRKYSKLKTDAKASISPYLLMHDLLVSHCIQAWLSATLLHLSRGSTRHVGSVNSP